MSAQAVQPLGRAADAPSIARAQARATCAGLGLDTLTDDVVLVVSELVTNAVRHGLGQITMELEVHEGRVVVSVGDEGPGRPQLLAPVEHGAEGGRGLALVAAVAQEWGVRPAADGGKLVWCALGPEGHDQPLRANG